MRKLEVLVKSGTINFKGLSSTSLHPVPDMYQKADVVADLRASGIWKKLARTTSIFNVLWHNKDATNGIAECLKSLKKYTGVTHLEYVCDNLKSIATSFIQVAGLRMVFTSVHVVLDLQFSQSWIRNVW